MQRVRVAADRWNFELASGEIIVPLGGNILNDQHPAQGTLFDHFDAEDVDRRFAIMRDAGLNCVRQAIGVNRVFHPERGLIATGLKNWDTFITLAEKRGIYLMPVGGYIGGNDWFDVAGLADSGKALDDACTFWGHFTAHFANHPAIWSWDLRNELVYTTHSHSIAPEKPDEAKVDAMIKDRWPLWLETRYGSVAAMNRAYGSRYAAFTDVPGSIDFVEKPFDLCAADFRNYLNDRGYAWCKRQCDVIRANSPLHMIVQGNNPWLQPDLDLMLSNGFHNRALHELFDFVTFHPYPAWQCLPGGHGDPLSTPDAMEYWLRTCVGMARIDFYNKPVVVQEFGWYGGGESSFFCPLPYRSEADHARYTQALFDALMPHVNGFLNWPTFDMPAAKDISNHGGIFTHDGRSKELTKTYRALSDRLQGQPLQRRAATKTLTFSLLGLYTSRLYQDRMWDQVHAALIAGEVPDFRFI